MKKRRFSRRRNRKGLTLMEIMLVLVILAILGSMATMFITSQQKNAMRQATATEISTLETALQQYHLAMFTYPQGQDGLRALVDQPSGDSQGRWSGPYIDPTNDLKDPWMNDYELSFETINNSQVPIIKSPGPDGSLGTEDDVSSQDEY